VARACADSVRGPLRDLAGGKRRRGEQTPRPRQRHRVVEPRRSGAGRGGTRDGGARGLVGHHARGPTPPPAPARPSNTRYFGVYTVDPERYGRDLARLGQEILMQLAAVEDAQLEITVEVQARSAKGFPEEKIRTILENARTLKFQQSSFEDD
jgi:hypothetical protein